MRIHDMKDTPTLIFDYEYSESNCQLWVTTVRWASFNNLLLLAFSQKYLIVLFRNSSLLKPLVIRYLELEYILNAEFLTLCTNCKCLGTCRYLCFGGKGSFHLRNKLGE